MDRPNEGCGASLGGRILHLGAKRRSLDFAGQCSRRHLADTLTGEFAFRASGWPALHYTIKFFVEVCSAHEHNKEVCLQVLAAWKISIQGTPAQFMSHSGGPKN